MLLTFAQFDFEIFTYPPGPVVFCHIWKCHKTGLQEKWGRGGGREGSGPQLSKKKKKRVDQGRREITLIGVWHAPPPPHTQ